MKYQEIIFQDIIFPISAKAKIIDVLEPVEVERHFSIDFLLLRFNDIWREIGRDEKSKPLEGR